MVPQQTSGGAPWRLQYPAFRWRSYVVSGQGLTARGELLGRQRYEAPFACSIDPLMHSLAAAVEHEIAKTQANSTVRQGCAGIRWKRNKRLCRRQREKADARQIFAATKTVEMTQIQPRQAGIEASAAGHDEIDSPGADGGAVVVRTGKRECAAFRHPVHLIRGTTPSRTAIAKTCRIGAHLRSSYATSEARF